MNETRQSLPWSRILLTLVVFIAVLGVAFFYREQIKETVLIPILYLFWLVDLLVKMFSQQCIWFLALLIALFLSMAFSRRKEQPVGVHQITVMPHPTTAGRVQFWRSRIRVDSGGIYTRSYRRLDMHRLVLGALAYHENKSEDEIKEQLTSGQLRVPVEVSDILRFNGQPVEPEISMGFIDRIRYKFVWVKEWLIPSRFLPDSRLEKVAEYLESLVEVDHGIRGR